MHVKIFSNLFKDVLKSLDDAHQPYLEKRQLSKSMFKEAKDQVSMLYNFFPSLLMMRPNKLECLYLAITFQSSLAFAGSTRSLPMKDALKGAPIGLALALP
jgi:hypothetical protein